MPINQKQNSLIEQVNSIFLEKIPFNKVLGIELESLEKQRIALRINMRDELIGNFIQETLHGGVISSLLDVIGGLTAFLNLIKRMEECSDDEKLQRLARFGTIDLRIDFLRPGRGKFFLATGDVLRMGNKVAVTRMELHNDEETLIAVGTGTYVVS